MEETHPAWQSYIPVLLPQHVKLAFWHSNRATEGKPVVARECAAVPKETSTTTWGQQITLGDKSGRCQQSIAKPRPLPRGARGTARRVKQKSVERSQMILMPKHTLRKANKCSFHFLSNANCRTTDESELTPLHPAVRVREVVPNRSHLSAFSHHSPLCLMIYTRIDMNNAWFPKLMSCLHTVSGTALVYAA